MTLDYERKTPEEVIRAYDKHYLISIKFLIIKKTRQKIRENLRLL